MDQNQSATEVNESSIILIVVVIILKHGGIYTPHFFFNWGGVAPQFKWDFNLKKGYIEERNYFWNTKK